VPNLCRFARAAGACALLSLATSQLHAADIAVVNAGFESPAQAPGSFTGGNPPGWTVFGAGGDASVNGVYNPNGIPYYTVALPEGNNLAYSYDGEPADNTGAFGLTQLLSATLQPLTDYTLRVAVGNPLAANGYNLAGFPGYQVQLLAGGVVLAQDNNTLAGTFPEGTFADSVVTFSTGSSPVGEGLPLEIRLINLNPSDSVVENEVDFDNVRLTAVPEPGSVALLGLAGLALRRTSRRHLGR